MIFETQNIHGNIFVRSEIGNLVGIFVRSVEEEIPRDRFLKYL